MKKNNAFAGFLETAQHKIKFGLRRHISPVGGPNIRAKYCISARDQAVFEALRVCKARKTKEVCARSARCFGNRGDAFLNICLSGRIIH